jgi:MFS family permease
VDMLQTQSVSETDQPVSFWRNPAAWLQGKQLSRAYWTFFAAAFFLDAGFSVYHFLFNLYLLDMQFNERTMGLLGSAIMVGSLAGTLPAGMLARRFGLRPLLLVCFTVAPLLQMLRVVWLWPPALIGLSFLSGLAMSGWGVCFLPAVARLTSERNRTAAFSLIFSVSVGTTALGGVICGYLPVWLGKIGFVIPPAKVKELILISSCAVVVMGLAPVLRLRMPLSQNHVAIERLAVGWIRWWKSNSFLLRFLLSMALWSAVTSAFTPFANVYLSSSLHIPMTRIGLVFSTAQVLQFSLGLLAPVVFRLLGLVNGIVATQIATAFALACLAGARDGRWAVVFYLLFSAAQWMSAPGLYNLLMTKTADSERSTAAAMTLFCNALAGSAATAATGTLITQFGYKVVLLGIGGLALTVAALFRLMVSPRDYTNPIAG